MLNDDYDVADLTLVSRAMANVTSDRMASVRLTYLLWRLVVVGVLRSPAAFDAPVGAVVGGVLRDGVDTARFMVAGVYRCGILRTTGGNPARRVFVATVTDRQNPARAPLARFVLMPDGANVATHDASLSLTERRAMLRAAQDEGFTAGPCRVPMAAF